MTLSILERNINRQLKRRNLCKAAKLDSTSVSTLKHCCNQLSLVFRNTFNTTLGTFHVPASKPPSSTLSPEKNKDHRNNTNIYRLIILIAMVMKSFECLSDLTAPLLDPVQLAYRANRSVDDARKMVLHIILKQLDSSGPLTRMLFGDFILIFNTFIPVLCSISSLSWVCLTPPAGRSQTSYLTGDSV